VSGFLLDTNVLSEFKRRGEPDQHVRNWLRATDPDLLWASVVSFGEIRKGIERLALGHRRTELEEWVARDLDQWSKSAFSRSQKRWPSGGECSQPELWIKEPHSQTSTA
jgi:predicted nucleic acid-binding protein